MMSAIEIFGQPYSSIPTTRLRDEDSATRMRERQLDLSALLYMQGNLPLR